MEKRTPPPHEESPEEAGAQIIRKLLDTPDVPPTLEEDLLETNARITQKEITTLQLAMGERKRHLIVLVASQTEQHLREHPSFTKEQQQSRVDAANAFVRKQIDELRKDTQELIDAAYVIQKLREADIRIFCRKKDPPSPSISLTATPTAVPAA